MSKYEPLWNYVMQHEPGQFSLTFDEIEDKFFPRFSAFFKSRD